MGIRFTARRSRGSVFLLAMVALLSLIILGVALLEIAINGLDRAAKDQKRAQAFALAESGVDMALARLYDDYDSINEKLAATGTYTSSYTLPEGEVTFTVTAPYAGISKTCEITSTSTTWANRSETIRVVASYLENPARTFRGAIFSDSPLTISGNVKVYPDAAGEGAEIYANGDITVNGTAATFNDGPGGLPDDCGSIYTTGSIAPEDVLDGCPSSNVYQHIAPIPMPVIDLNLYKDMAQHPASYGTEYVGVYISGKKTFNSSDLDFATLYPGKTVIVYVDGDVRITGQYTGNAMIVASGKIDVTGNITTTSPTTNSLALMSPKAIKLNGNATVEGLIYAHGVEVDADIFATGSVVIKGAICADVVTTRGDLTVYYSDVWSGLPLPGTGKTQWAQISWEELFL